MLFVLFSCVLNALIYSRLVNNSEKKIKKVWLFTNRVIFI